MTAPTKYVSFDELVRIVEELRRENRQVVHCHGVFDLLHIGHIRYLQSAKRRGDVLIVTVTPDRFVNKGPHRPVFEEHLRTQAIASLDCVDYVAVNNWPTAVEAIRRLRPHVYTKGAEFRNHKTPEILKEEAEAEALGVRVDFIDDDITASSSYLINHFLSPFSEEVDRYLSRIRAKWKTGDQFKSLELARDLKVLVVGDAILDEYVFCSTFGQSTKSPNIVGRFQTQEGYLSGALSVANHLAGFCSHVDLITILGDDPRQNDDIYHRLRPAIHPNAILREGRSATLRRQFRDSYFSTTLFEIDYLDESPVAPATRDQIDANIRDAIAACDLVVVADYGYGMLNETTIQLLCNSAPFLAVTTPASAANLGYHTISQYPRSDFFALAEHDLRLDRRNRQQDLNTLLQELTSRLGARKSLVTLGARGCFAYSPAEGFEEAPAVATRIVDRQGAAEAAFAISALSAVLGFPLDQLAFLANVAGAQAAATVGNSHFLDNLSTARAIESLLK